MTSRFEGLPMTLLETKPYKLPIVSFDCKTGPKELIKEDQNGYLAAEGNINHMSEKICKLIESKELRKRLSEMSIVDMEKFELKGIMDNWRKILSEI